MELPLASKRKEERGATHVQIMLHVGDSRSLVTHKAELRENQVHRSGLFVESTRYEGLISTK